MDASQKNQLRGNLRESYNKTAQERENGTMQDWKVKVRANFLSLLQKAGKKTLLEIGAGTGRDSKFFHDQGFETVSIDLSPAMVELCQQKGLTAYVMDAGEMAFTDASFDAVYAMNSFLHLSKAEFPGILQAVSRLLKPEGLFFLGVYGGIDSEGIWENDAYEPKRFFSFFTDDQIQQEVAKMFDIVSFNQIETERDSGLHFQALILKQK